MNAKVKNWAAELENLNLKFEWIKGVVAVSICALRHYVVFQDDAAILDHNTTYLSYIYLHTHAHLLLIFTACYLTVNMGISAILALI